MINRPLFVEHMSGYIQKIYLLEKLYINNLIDRPNA